jgi:hypothetical protein
MKRRDNTSTGRSAKGTKRSGAAKARSAATRAAKTNGSMPRAAKAKARPPATKGTPRAGAKARTAKPRGAARRSRAKAPALPFWSREWAQAARQAVNDGPSPEARAKKIERFWEWIEDAREHVNCQLALAVKGRPGRSTRDCLLLDLEEGRCVRARLATRDDAEASARYILAGSYGDWREIMSGFDMGKAVMYRKLLLEKGEVLEFFKSIYYWTESLACIQAIPTEFPGSASRPN